MTIEAFVVSVRIVFDKPMDSTVECIEGQRSFPTGLFSMSDVSIP
jgi:hypothetical protein